MMAATKRKIALFGSSLNPPTLAHVAIVEYFAKLFDQVWVMPVYTHAYSSKASSLESFPHRFAMSEIAFKHVRNAKVKRTEEEVCAAFFGNNQRNDIVPGTCDVVEFIMKENAASSSESMPLDVHLILGADTYADLLNGKWKNGDRLQKLVTVHRVHRDGLEAAEDNVAGDCLHRHHHHVIERMPALVSSSHARTTADERTLQRLLPNAVVRYMMKHNLYAFRDNE